MGDARDPEQVRKLVEELWRHSFETLKSVTKSQRKEFQASLQEWSEAATKGLETATSTTGRR